MTYYQQLNFLLMTLYCYFLFCMIVTLQPENEVNKNPQRVFEWIRKWKMLFNLDLMKQEVIFSRKLAKPPHPAIIFNNAPVFSCLLVKTFRKVFRWDFIILTNLLPMHPFSTPWKYQKIFGFFMFSGGRERVYWEQMG